MRHHQETATDARRNLDLIDEFVTQAEVTPATQHKYRAHLHEFNRWLGHPNAQRAGTPVTLTDAGPADVHRFMQYLRGDDRFAAVTHHRVTGALSASARKNYLSSLRSFYGYLVAMRVIPSDPSASIRPPRVPRIRGLHLTPSEIRAILDASGSPRDRIQAHLLVYTAARTAEIRNLRWSDIDLAARSLVLHGKNDTTRTVDIHPQLSSELRRWFVIQDDASHTNPAIRAARSAPETDFVLLTRRGKPVTPTTISKQLKARATRAGVKLRANGRDTEVSPHALRRSFATIMLNAGHSLDAVADVLGHASLDTTRRHYAFTNNQRRRATIDAYQV